MALNETLQPKKIQVRYGLFLIFLFFMAFYEGSCSSDYGVGFPLYIYAHESATPATIWQPLELDDPLQTKLALVGINFVVILLMALTFSLWFRTRFFLTRYPKFILSHVVVFIYTFFFLIVHWTEIVFAVLQLEETNLLNFCYRLTILPLEHVAVPLVMPVAMLFGDYSPLALMGLGFIVVLFVMYWLLFVACLLCPWLK